MSNKCHDCGVCIGELHKEGCDGVTCTVCGTQLLICGHYPEGNAKWTGEMYPEERKICEERNLWCRDFVDGKPVEEVDFEKLLNDEIDVKWHVPCNKDDYGAHHDLNRSVKFLIEQRRVK